MWSFCKPSWLHLFTTVYLRKGMRQHTQTEANESRIVTKTRWIVETRNGHLKSVFRFFRDMIDIHHFLNIGDFFWIACAIINAFFPLIYMHDIDANYAPIMLERIDEPNIVQAKVEEENLMGIRTGWIDLTHEHLPGFPELSIEYLREKTM